MARSDVHPYHEFASWQVWPGSYKNPPVDGTFPSPDTQNLRIDKSTPIASMGSCFAREIKKKLVVRGYNYITEEVENPASVHASAAWERTYNTFSMRQIFAYTFDSFSPQLRWWQIPNDKRIQDPFRRIILYDTINQAEEDFAAHVKASRQALTKASLLVLTLGLTEVWEDKEDGSVICLPSGPYPNSGGDMSRYRFRVTRYQENLENLEYIYRTMKKHNPECSLLVTVSPVHLWATFRQDCDVISASCNSKSTLRAVADEFAASHENVTYFPAYEMATIYSMLMQKTYFGEGKENFHVNKDTVRFIMNHFFKFYHPQNEKREHYESA